MPAFRNHTQLVPGKRMEFDIDGVDVSIVNALRRVVLSEIPNIAIPFNPYKEADNHITIHTNTCPLHNEIISHRLSLIPICIHPNDLSSPDLLGYKYIIHKKNTTNELMDVTTDDVVIHDSKGHPVSKDVAKTFFPYDAITKSPVLITKLRPNIFDKEHGDEIHLEATAELGTAAKNACWSPVSQCTFENVIDTALASKALKEKLADKSKEERAKISSHFEVLEKYRYFKRNQYDEPCYFRFKVESECRFTPEFIIFKGMLVLLDKLKDVNERMSKIQSLPHRDSATELHTIGNVPGFYQLVIHGEMHTLGNLLQAYLYNHYIREGKTDFLSYIGYNCPHPLENTVVFRFKVNNDTVTPQELASFWSGAIDNLITSLSDLTDEWVQFAKLDENEYDEVLLWGQSK